jgi:hypothetical protein
LPHPFKNNKTRPGLFFHERPPAKNGLTEKFASSFARNNIAGRKRCGGDSATATPASTTDAFF